MSSKAGKKKIRIVPGFIANDFWRKLIALFFAVLVWERVTTRIDDTQKLRGIPVQISMPEGFVIIDDKRPRIDVTLKGSKQRLNKLVPGDIETRLDVKHPQIGQNRLYISKKDIRAPKGVSVAGIEPEDYIIVHLDEKLTKQVPVKLKYSGSLLDGYALNTSHIIPDSVTISGPKSLVEKITSVSTRNIVLTKENVDDFECRAYIRNESAKLSVIPKDVLVGIEIYKKYVSRTFKAVPIKPFGFIPKERRLVVSPDLADVAIEGEKNEVELVTPEQIHAFIDLSSIDKPGEYTLNVQCWTTNKKLNVKEITPRTVNIKISE